MRFSPHATIISVAIFTSLAASAYDQVRPAVPNPLNISAGSEVLYEVQVRAANASYQGAGNSQQQARHSTRPGGPSTYRAGDASNIPAYQTLEKNIKLGTLDDLMEPTTDYRQGITLKYIHDRVGATTVWLMPMFPNNDKWNLPDPGDNLGSPYAVRDYFHLSGGLSRDCLKKNADEYSFEDHQKAPCWANDRLDQLIHQADGLNLKIMLDVALNHFGHNYLMYDYASFQPVRARLAAGASADDLWGFDKTFDADLVNPQVLDSAAALAALAASKPAVKADLAALQAKCPALEDDDLVRAFNIWRDSYDWERAQFDCAKPVYLEIDAPGFYLGSGGGNAPGGPHPSHGVGDNFTNNWVDVKFLYHHEYHNTSDAKLGDYYNIFVRNREYLFRILNYWVSRGVRGFRFDHATDYDSGMGPNEWRYLVTKVNYYDWVRKGRPASGYVPPIYMAEEFSDQQGMAMEMDMMTDGYIGDIRGGNGATKNTSFVEGVLQNDARFTQGRLADRGGLFIMRALEDHDEHRLYDGTGFDEWTGAGFWGIGAASRGTPMILMGQEFGETYGLAFRRSDFLRARFEGQPGYRVDGDALVDFYGQMNRARLDPKNAGLRGPYRWFLRTRQGDVDQRIVAQARWNDDPVPSVVFTFNNLWSTTDVEQSYIVPDELASHLLLRDDLKYRLVDALSGETRGNCRLGSELKSNFYVKLSGTERLQWLRLELCQ